jgi:soluble lytic murein transglycosylase
VDKGSVKAAPITPVRKAPDQFEKVFSKLITQESGGKHVDSSGNLTTSPAGARGITQLMPATAKNPGFNIEGVRDKSEGEYLRVGKEYLNALKGKYNGDYEMALAAFNAGTGNVDKAINKAKEKGGSFLDYLPKRSETINYINKILGTRHKI